MSQERIANDLTALLVMTFGLTRDHAARCVDEIAGRYWLAPKPNVASQPEAGEQVWVLVPAEVKPDRYQPDPEDGETAVEIEGGWVYTFPTSELIRPSTERS